MNKKAKEYLKNCKFQLKNKEATAEKHKNYKKEEFKKFLRDKKFPDTEDFYIVISYGKLNIKEALDTILSVDEGEEKREEDKGSISSCLDRVTD